MNIQKKFKQIEESIDSLISRCEKANNSLFKKKKVKGLCEEAKAIIHDRVSFNQYLIDTEDKTSEEDKEFVMKKNAELDRKMEYLVSEIGSLAN